MYDEIEHALVLFAILSDPPELRRVLGAIDHPAAVRAGELLAMGRIAEAEAVLEGVLCVLAGPPTGTGLTWFSGHHIPGRAART